MAEQDIAEEQGVNCSKILQAALIEYLDIDGQTSNKLHRRPQGSAFFVLRPACLPSRWVC